MIADQLKRRTRYAGMGAVSEVLAWLETLDLSRLRPGKVEVGITGTSANLLELTTRTEIKNVFEAHRVHIDVHYMVRGEEMIGMAGVESLAPSEAFDENNDVGFYSGPPEGTLILKPGGFAVLYPGEAHEVALASREPGTILKMVVKIRV